MPRSYLMTWDPGPRRWRKVYKGITYTVSCRDLKVPQTKDVSYQTANAWWTAKRADIDKSTSPPSDRHHERVISKLEKRLEWCLANGELHLVGGIQVLLTSSPKTASYRPRIASTRAWVLDFWASSTSG
jgi:hypothetical protein